MIKTKQKALPYIIFALLLIAGIGTYYFFPKGATQSPLAPSPSPRFELPSPTIVQNPYEVRIDSNEFKFMKDNKEIYTYYYKPNPDEKKLFTYPPPLLHDNYLIFHVRVLPTGCSDPDVDLESCRQFLSGLQDDENKFGGIWTYNIQTQKVTYLLPLPKLGYENADFASMSVNDQNELVVKLEKKDDDDKVLEEKEIIVDIINGTIKGN